MKKQDIKLVITGHVDHGKSTLIGRLLYDTGSLAYDKIREVEKVSSDRKFAYFLDHLKEEREGDITIDTTQVFLKSGRTNYVIIDAPGHVEFVKNMITGASQADSAVLIVDVIESLKEQTKRHAHLLSLLGFKEVIVVLNKMDLVNYKQEQFLNVKNEINKFLESINMAIIHCIPISALNGENIIRRSKKMSWYKGAPFLKSLTSFKRETLNNKTLIFPVQDVYNINGETVIAGRIISGSLRRSQTIKILPAEKTTKIKSIEKYPWKVVKAYSCESIGITLLKQLPVKRGDVICSPDKTPLLRDKFSATVFWMEDKRFDKNKEMIMRYSTQEVTCRIEKINKRINSSTLKTIKENVNVLENLDMAEVVIKTKKPIVIANFNNIRELGRFILVKNGNTYAVGIITTSIWE
ncbi:MAG: GTP-binding protein [Candidatus Saelkia tenebricola]|nr:GTP-binding protein [Candidatus Saelkia tenebricola]